MPEPWRKKRPTSPTWRTPLVSRPRMRRPCRECRRKRSPGPPGKSLASSVEVAKSAKAAAADLERYRENLEIAGDGLGDETVWTDVIKVGKAVLSKF